MIWEFGYRRSKMEKIYRRIRTVYTIANTGQGIVLLPGTIHAVISLTDCYGRGGMCWGRSTIRDSIRVWKDLVKSPDCTNEYLPRQSRGVLKYLRNNAIRDPAQFELAEEGLAGFLENCEVIAAKSLRCSCIKCKNSCGCRKSGQPCGSLCHPDIQEACSNPLGQVMFEQ